MGVNVIDSYLSLGAERKAKLSVGAYLLAKECGRVAAMVSSASDKFHPDHFIELAGELSFLHSRMLLLGGYFAGLISVEEGALSVEAEEVYMNSSRALLESINGVLESFDE